MPSSWRWVKVAGRRGFGRLPELLTAVHARTAAIAKLLRQAAAADA